jgi:hypothetical protein
MKAHEGKIPLSYDYVLSIEHGSDLLMPPMPPTLMSLGSHSHNNSNNNSPHPIPNQPYPFFQQQANNNVSMKDDNDLNINPYPPNNSSLPIFQSNNGIINPNNNMISDPGHHF